MGEIGSADTTPGWTAVLGGGRGRRIGQLMLVIVLHAGGNFMVVTLAPSIVAEVGGGVLLGALTALFNVATILAAVSVGALAGRCGTTVLLRCMALACVLGGLLSATANAMPMVAVGRAIAGFGGGGLVALAFIALRAQGTAAAWPKISALLGIFWIGAAFAGPMLGGVLADSVGWRAAFAMLAVAALGYAVANRRLIGALDPSGPVEPFPLGRALGFGSGVALVSFAPLLQPVPIALAAGAAGLALTVVAAVRDRTHPPRIFPRNAFEPSTDLGRALMAKLLLGAGAMSVLIFGPILLVEVHGRSAVFAGGFVVIETLSWSSASLLIATVTAAGARRLARIGPLISLFGLVGCAVYLVGGHLPGAALAIAACGAGLGLAWPLLGQKMVGSDEADPSRTDERAKTMALVSSADPLGFAIGGALIGLVASLAVGGVMEGAADVERAATAGILASIPLTALGLWACARALSDPPP